MIDDGSVAEQARAILPEGLDTALELIGTPTLPDTLRATRVHGVVCFTGMLSSQWTVRDFYPIEYLPRGVRLTAYGGEAGDLPARVLQEFLDAVAASRAVVPSAPRSITLRRRCADPYSRWCCPWLCCRSAGRITLRWGSANRRATRTGSLTARRSICGTSTSPAG
jgi:hypothetical protein